MPAIGKTAGGWNATRAYRPSLVDFAFDIIADRSNLTSLTASISIPDGWTFETDKHHLIRESPRIFFGI